MQTTLLFPVTITNRLTVASTYFYFTKDRTQSTVYEDEAVDYTKMKKQELLDILTAMQKEDEPTYPYNALSHVESDRLAGLSEYQSVAVRVEYVKCAACG